MSKIHNLRTADDSFKVTKVTRMTRSNTSPDLIKLGFASNERLDTPISPLLDIYMQLPSPTKSHLRYDPFDIRTPFHDYIDKKGRKHSNPNWQGELIIKPILKKTSNVEKTLQLFSLILRFEKSVKQYEKPSICSYILQVVQDEQGQDDVEICDELCCLLMKQLMNNKLCAHISWALFALVFPYLTVSEEIRHLVIYTMNMSSPSQFGSIVKEVKYRAVEHLKKRSQRPSTTEIEKYEKTENEFILHLEYNQKPIRIAINNYDTGKKIITKLGTQANINMNDYCIVMRDSLGECFCLTDEDYIFDLISAGDMLKFMHPKWFVRRRNWEIHFHDTFVDDSLYFLQMGVWIPLKTHSCDDNILALYKSLINVGLVKIDPLTESNIVQIFSQIAAKDIAPTFNIPKLIEKLPYYGSMRYLIKCENLVSNSLVIYNGRIVFMKGDNHELTIPMAHIMSCEMEGLFVNIISGTENSSECIQIKSSSGNCIVEEIRYQMNHQPPVQLNKFT